MINIREPLTPAATPEAKRVNRWLEGRFQDAREIHQFEKGWGGYWYIVTEGRAFGVGATTEALEDARVIVGLNEFVLLSLLALWFAGRPATPSKTYGYYRMEILSALVNGVLLLVITGFIFYEAFQRFQAPTPVDLKPMVIVSIIGLAANLASLSFLQHTHSMNVRAAFLHVVGDTLSSVGVLVGAGIMAWTGWLQVDAVISVMIACVVVYGALRLVRDAVDVLLEAVPAHVDMEAVKGLMLKVSGVSAVHDLHVWTISSGLYALSAHLVVSDPMTCNNDEILSAVKHELLDRFGIDHTTIQIESETYAHAGEVH